VLRFLKLYTVPVVHGSDGRAVARRRRPQATRKRHPKNLIDDVTAILLISPNADRLCEFYRATLGLPLEDELHDGIRLHYGYSLGDVHFAIHSADGGWPGGARRRDARSPVITFSTSNVKALVKRLSANGVAVTGPTEHGFGLVISFRDPDRNLVSIIEYGSEHW
jgi:catechol 2,3-dioxygenase-like lactoylglutathione lyase family enzyme